MTDRSFEKDLYLLFNLAFDNLEKTDLRAAPNDNEIAELENFLREQEHAEQIAVIHTRSKEYPRAILYRKIVKGNAVMFAFWKRRTIYEGIVVSLDGSSRLNEFLWVQDKKTGKSIAALRPKAAATKLRQSQMKRVGVMSALVEPLNRSEYYDKFGSDILKKLGNEKESILASLKERNLVPKDAVDPATIEDADDEGEIAADGLLGTEVAHSEFVAAVNPVSGSVISGTQKVEDLNTKLMQEFRQDAIEAEREERLERKKQEGANP
jgi:hypothetical protein